MKSRQIYRFNIVAPWVVAVALAALVTMPSATAQDEEPADIETYPTTDVGELGYQDEESLEPEFNGQQTFDIEEGDQEAFQSPDEARADSYNTDAMNVDEALEDIGEDNSAMDDDTAPEFAEEPQMADDAEENEADVPGDEVATDVGQAAAESSGNPNGGTEAEVAEEEDKNKLAEFRNDLLSFDERLDLLGERLGDTEKEHAEVRDAYQQLQEERRLLFDIYGTLDLDDSEARWDRVNKRAATALDAVNEQLLELRGPVLREEEDDAR